MNYFENFNQNCDVTRKRNLNFKSRIPHANNLTPSPNSNLASVNNGVIKHSHNLQNLSNNR